MTRVERQAGGGRLIKEIPNFRALFNAGDYDPLQIVSTLREDQ